ncbi:GNAT family N-acetyltransferase [Sutcliffiella sp. NPDC057660]|uniref:GNAT family N-acetyltransferase n=1 Tax=Sutcliffiella sp. NPDC057660 TaxID=3346199 RepID=UPI0036A29336
MEEIPDLNIFMMCPSLNREALTELPEGFHVRNLRKDEMDIWMAMPFDDPETAKEYKPFMEDFFDTTYGLSEELFFEKTLVVCDKYGESVATCLLWKAYGLFYTIHWFKVLPSYEGKGIGRALLSIIMKDLKQEDYPVYLHTQPGSYRAIKLYSDFGFDLLSGEKFGSRPNELEESLPFLEKYMPKRDFEKLRTTEAPEHFIETLKSVTTIQF